MREPCSLSFPLLEDAQATTMFLSKRRATANGLRVGELSFDTTDEMMPIFDLVFHRDMNGSLTVNSIASSD